MAALTEQVATTYSDYNVPGLPASSEKEPQKPEIRSLLYGILSAIDSAVVAAALDSGAVVFATTRSALFANLVPGAGSLGIVTEDPVDELNGIYKKIGGTGTGSWSNTGLVTMASIRDQLDAVVTGYANVTAQVASALSSANAAAADRVLAQTARTDAQASAGGAAASALAAAAYASASNLYKTYATKAEATADLANIPANGWIAVLIDEGQGGTVTRYRKESGILVLKLKSGQKEVRPEYFGAMADNVTDDRTAILAARTWVLANGGEIVLSAGKTYFVSDTTFLTLNGVTIRPEAGVKIRGKFDRKASYILTAPLTLLYEDGEFDYPEVVLTSKYIRDISEKESFLTASDINRAVSVPINSDEWVRMTTAWPSDTFTTTVDGNATDSNSLIYAMIDGTWHLGLSNVLISDQVSMVFDYGEYTRVAVLFTAKGYYWVTATGMEGAMELWYKGVGVSAVKISDLTWPGKGVTDDWEPGYASWVIDLFSPTQFAIRLNGVILNGIFKTAAGDFLTGRVGFGMTAPTTGDLGGISFATLTRDASTGGLGYIHLLTAGDSRTAPFWGDWPTECAELLEGSLGRSMLKMENIAVDGWTTETTLDTITTHGFLGVTHMVYGAMTNDVQTGADLETDTIPNVEDAIDAAQAEGVRVIVVLFPSWYSDENTGGNGITTFQAGLAARYREAIRKVAASRGCTIVDLQQELKPIIAVEMQDAPADARYAGKYITGTRDNIHFGNLACKVIAQAVARAILSDVPERSRVMVPTSAPTAWFAAPFSSNGSLPLKMALDGDRVILSGWLHTSTTTGVNADAVNIPDGLRPLQQVQISAVTSAGNRVRVNISSKVVIVDALGGSDTDVCLDGASWSIQ